MASNTKYLILDDVCYSTQLVIAELMGKLYVDWCENPDKIVTEEDKENFLTSKALLEIILKDERNLDRYSLFNAFMTRFMWSYLNVDESFLNWLLSKFTNIEDIPVRVSGIMAIIGVPEVLCVYQPSNTVELLVLKKLNLLGVLPNLITDEEMGNRLKREKLQYSTKEERSSIFTANELLLDSLHDDFVMLAPINFPWIKDRAVVAVETWVLDKEPKEEDKNKEEFKNEHDRESGTTEEDTFGDKSHSDEQ